VRIYATGDAEFMGGKFYALAVATFDNVSTDELAAAPLKFIDNRTIDSIARQRTLGSCEPDKNIAWQRCPRLTTCRLCWECSAPNSDFVFMAKRTIAWSILRQPMPMLLPTLCSLLKDLTQRVTPGSTVRFTFGVAQVFDSRDY
jgi:hypothetical protein